MKEVPMSTTLPTVPFETLSLHMEAQYLVELLAPQEDVARILDHVAAITPLAIGAYDRNAFETAPGIEHYRPLAGAAAGAESETRHRPGVVTVAFQIERDDALLARVVEEIYQVHSYQEPTILVRETLASRTKGLDDRDNPHRWWNTTGDWKKAGEGKAGA
jgi:hypothetical protein